MNATIYWPIEHAPESDRERAIREAAKQIRAGGIVAFPTETVYGLGADARNTRAVERIYAAKGRPSDNPLIVHIADRSQLDGLVRPYGETAGRLMERFWPGPLTLVLPAVPGAVSPRVTGGLTTIAVRMPAHQTALALIAAAGTPIAAPSANRSGRPSPTRAEHVRDDLDGKIDGLLDDGPAGIGLESTVVEVDGDKVTVLRPGGITLDDLRRITPEVALDPSLERAKEGPAGTDGDSGTASQPTLLTPRSPGMKYAHYAPRGEMILVTGRSEQDVVIAVQSRIDAAARRGETTGVLTYAEHASLYQADHIVICGSLLDPAASAQSLYEALRQFDRRGVTYIVAEGCPEEGLGLALMNRLRKASAGRVVRV